MQKLIGQARELKSRWEVYAGAEKSPDALQRQIPKALTDVIEQSLGSIEIWLEQSDEKPDLSPGSLIAKSMAAVFLPELLATMGELEQGRFSQLHCLTDGLANLQTTILSAEACSDREQFLDFD